MRWRAAHSHRHAWLAMAVLVLMTGAGRTDAEPPDLAPAASIAGVPFNCPSRATDPGAADCARALLGRLRAITERAFITHNRLEATDAEVARVRAYLDAFERHDRAQRARKLGELEQRLADPTLAEGERERITRFRDTLARLARYEADVDAGIEIRDPVPADVLQGWIETVRIDRVLHERFGGVIGVAPHGPYAHGARARLIDDALARGDVVVHDQVLLERMRALLHAPPRILHRDPRPDFTPFWERPIPPSYMPD